MRVTRKQLRKIIREESFRALREQTAPEPPEPGEEDEEDEERDYGDSRAGRPDPKAVPWRKITEEMAGQGGKLVAMDKGSGLGQVYFFGVGDHPPKGWPVKMLMRVKNEKGQSAKELGIEIRRVGSAVSGNKNVKLGRASTDFEMVSDAELIFVAYNANADF